MTKMLSVKEAAEQATVSPSLIYSLLRQGRLAGVRIGCRGRGSWRIEEPVLEAYIAACRTTPDSDSESEAPLRHLR